SYLRDAKLSYFSGNKIKGALCLPDTVAMIGSYALYKCKDLTNVTIQDSVTSIREAAFTYCSNLTSIKVRINEPLNIKPNVFDGVDKANCTLYVPKGSLSGYSSAEVWKDFVNIVEFDEYDPDAKKYDVNGDGVVDVADITALAKYILTNAKEEIEE
ncbi:MAG: leucine-rich repeat protein, partial [Bacteroidales bacterium]|nr:leucine-rich repeat protein [Bacteroidales bacterium]